MYVPCCSSRMHKTGVKGKMVNNHLVTQILTSTEYSVTNSDDTWQTSLTFRRSEAHLTVGIFRVRPCRKELFQWEHLAVAWHRGERTLWTGCPVRRTQSPLRRRGDTGRGGRWRESRGAEVGLGVAGESKRRTAVRGRSSGVRGRCVGGWWRTSSSWWGCGLDLLTAFAQHL